MSLPFVLVVSGSRNSGKTALCLKIFEHFSRQKFSIGGVVTLKGKRDQTKGDKRFVQNLTTGERALLAIRKPDGRYRFIPAGVRFANNAMRDFNGDILIVDEVGKLEKKGRGFKEVFKKLKTSLPKAVVITCRDKNVKWLTEKIGQRFLELDTKNSHATELALKLISQAIA